MQLISVRYKSWNVSLKENNSTRSNEGDSLPDVIELGRGFPIRVELLSPTTARPDDEPVLEVRHELDVLLLLLHPDHLELFAEQGLELLLEAEGERQPAHVARITALYMKNVIISFYC